MNKSEPDNQVEKKEEPSHKENSSFDSNSINLAKLSLDEDLSKKAHNLDVIIQDNVAISDEKKKITDERLCETNDSFI